MLLLISLSLYLVKFYHSSRDSTRKTVFSGLKLLSQKAPRFWEVKRGLEEDCLITFLNNQIERMRFTSKQ